MPALVEGLVEDIPSENFSAIVRYDPCDVLLQERGNLFRREVLAGQPQWIRPSPYQSVAADFHSVHLREADYLVRLGEVEGFLIRTERRPLHVVLGLQHIEFAREGGGVRDLRKLIGPHGGTDQDSGAVGLLTQGLGEGGGGDE